MFVFLQLQQTCATLTPTSNVTTANALIWAWCAMVITTVPTGQMNLLVAFAQLTNAKITMDIVTMSAMTSPAVITVAAVQDLSWGTTTVRAMTSTSAKLIHHHAAKRATTLKEASSANAARDSFWSMTARRARLRVRVHFWFLLTDVTSGSSMSKPMNIVNFSRTWGALLLLTSTFRVTGSSGPMWPIHTFKGNYSKIKTKRNEKKKL